MLNTLTRFLPDPGRTNGCPLHKQLCQREIRPSRQLNSSGMGLASLRLATSEPKISKKLDSQIYNHKQINISFASKRNVVKIQNNISTPSKTSPAFIRESVIESKGREQRLPARPIKKKRRTLTILNIIASITLIFAIVRFGSIISPTDDQFSVEIGSQPAISIDLRQSAPISPYILGVNAFPQVDTNSVDKSFSGFMHTSQPVLSGLDNAHIKLIRFPGGNWGENHTLSFEQLDTFSRLLIRVNADGMIQARLSASQVGNTTDLQARAKLAGSWVDYMNNPRSSLRKHSNIPYHPVKFWTVGNEPDRLINPATGKLYTVAEYTADFIQFSKIMHQNDPSIKIFGPEISQFYGLGAGPVDATGQLWMEGFLKGIGAYEKAHHLTLLDGISFHRYPFFDARHTPDLLMGSASEWDYLMPALRQLVRQDMGRDIPLAVTEINTNPQTEVPTHGQAALWWADTLGRLMNQQADYVAFFSVEGVERPYPLFTGNGLQPTAMYRVMQLFEKLQANLIPISMQRDPISMYATQNKSHTAVSLLFVNKSSASQLVQIRGSEQLLHMSAWHNQDISLAGNSVLVITLYRDGGAEADSYLAPTAITPAVGQINHVTCGAKTDLLIATIPC